MNSSVKIVRLGELLGARIRPDKSAVVLCFGHFNVIHPGHLRYFQRARTHGSRLVVALEGDSLIRETERDEMFPELDRAQAVAALELVDQVVILDSGRVESLIGVLQPGVLVLGKEFESEQQDRVKEAVAAMADLGGRVLYEAGEAHYATADLLRGAQNEIERDRWIQFTAALHTHNIDLAQLAKSFSDSKPPRILVVGDTIVDRYVACDPVGMSNEAPVIVVKELESRDFAGGAAIVSAHVAALGAACDYLSVIGSDEPADTVKKQLAGHGVITHLFEDSSRPTTFKIRYLVENQKLFRVSRLKEHSLSRELEDKLIERILDLAPRLDGILVSDFVYGVITSRILQVLGDVSQKHNVPLFGDLQCSSQIGNISKFENFYLICPTEREARIALNNKEDGIERIANTLLEKTGSKHLIVKMGAEGFIAYEYSASQGLSRRQHFPALTANPVDVTGAGDSLLAATSVLMAGGYGLMEASALGACIASLSVETVGNLPVNLRQVRSLIKQRERQFL